MTTDADQPPLTTRLFGRLAGGGRSRSETIQARPKRGTTWPLRGLLTASLAVPLLLLAIAAWQNFRLVRSQAEERVMIEAGELRPESPLRKACERAKTAVAIGCYPDGERDLAKLIDDELRVSNLRIAQDARAALMALRRVYRRFFVPYQAAS